MKKIKHYVITSNKYNFLLEGYFYFYEKYWNSSNIKPTVLGYNKPDNFPEKYEFIQLADDDSHWANPLIGFFSTLDSDIFSLAFEDHYIVEKFKSGKFKKGITALREDLTLDKVHLMPRPRSTTGHIVGQSFKYAKTGKEALAISSLMPSIWRRSSFLEMLSKEQNTAHKFEEHNNNKDLQYKCLLPADNIPIYPSMDVMRKGKFDSNTLAAYDKGFRQWNTHVQELAIEDKYIFEGMQKEWELRKNLLY